MSNEPAPPLEPDKPGRAKIGIAGKLRRLVAILVLIVVAVLTVRTVAFAFAEKKYKSTALIGSKWAMEHDKPVMILFQLGGSFGQTVTEELCSSMLAERTMSHMRGSYAEMEPKPCQAEAPNIPNTYLWRVSVTAPDPTYAKVYLDMLIKVFFEFRKAEGEVISKARGQALQFGTMTAKQAGAISEELAETKAALDKFHRPSKELIEQLAEEETQQREAAEEQFTIFEHASPAVRVIPRFTFLRLL